MFWLPCFFFPQAFLTAVLQDHARRFRYEIDRLCFTFEFMDSDYSEQIESALRSNDQTEPAAGALVYGLYLEGAAWQQARKCLGESAPG